MTKKKYLVTCPVQVWFPYFTFEADENEDPYEAMDEAYNSGDYEEIVVYIDDIVDQLVPDDCWEIEEI